ncbi:tail fiber protein, partial [Yersinia enterocolitica]|nr:tail fiber protein [Yersinia enterocolitica]
MKNIMPPINTPDNAFHDGNPATGEQGTIVPGLWLNNIQGATRNTQQELISVLNEAEIEIDETKDNQLLTAILSLITANIPDLPAASLTQAGIVKLISSLTSDSESLAATAKAVKLVANAIVTSMSDHIQTANPHHQYLAIANFLSEIKDVGPAAVAQTLLNLGLGDAAKKSVGTGVNQIPDISYFLANLGFSGHQDVPSLDAAGNFGLRWGTMAAMTAGPGQTVTFTRPFSSNCVFAIAFLIRPGSTNTGTSETMYLVSKSATQATFSKGGSESYSAIYLAL